MWIFTSQMMSLGLYSINRSFMYCLIPFLILKAQHDAEEAKSMNTSLFQQ